MSKFTPPIEPGMLPSDRAITTFLRTVPFFRCIRLAGIFVKKLNSASEPTAMIGGTVQAKDQHGKQQDAAPHAGHSDQNTHNEPDQDFAC